jgi:carboxyl-terminal processing protease
MEESMFSRRIVSGLLFLLLLVPSLFAEDANVKAERSRAKSILKLVSSELKKYYHDPTMNGLDWEAQVKETEGRIERAQTVGGIYTSIVALVDKLNDSHTYFYPPDRAAYPQYGFRMKAYGDKVLVYKLNPKGAASKAGMQMGDHVVKLMNFPVTRKNYFRMMQFFTTVQPQMHLTATVLRDGQEIAMTIDPKIIKMAISNDVISNYNPYEYLLYKEFNIPRSYIHKANAEGIGYLYLSEFVYETSPADWADSIGPMKGMILDLRDNGGGSVDTLQNFAGFFVDKKLTMSEAVFKNKREKTEVKTRRNTFSGPVVILLDEGSASASESITRFMQLHRENVRVVGDTSMGALMQSRSHYEEIGAESLVYFYLQIGEAKVLFSDGKEVEHVGIQPDVACVPTQADIRAGKDPCLAIAMQELRKVMKMEGEAKELGAKTVINHWGLE